MLDLPQPPSPQMVIVILWGSGYDIVRLEGWACFGCRVDGDGEGTPWGGWRFV